MKKNARRRMASIPVMPGLVDLTILIWIEECNDKRYKREL
jgi:hypothetical protein